MKTAIVTGASGAIGSAIVEKFVKNGYFVIAQYNSNKTAIDNVKENLEKDGFSGVVFPFKADFTKIEDVNALYDYAITNFKKVDVLINNAGVDVYKLITETEEDEYDKVFNVNVKSAYFLSSLCLKEMIERKFGKIVFISSIWGKVGGSMETAYSASKSALIGLTKALAKEVAPSKINVNCICPGVIDSPMNDIFSDEEKQDLIERTPLKSMGTTEQVSALTYFLCSEQASFITGEAITIDGGFSL